MDTTRADHLSAYGYERPTSERLEQLAAEGVRFEVAYAPSATTGPSHASLFTSLHPVAHGVLKNGYPLAAGLATLAEQLTHAGFETGAVVSSYVLNAKFGYDRGFGDYDDDVSRAATPSGTRLWEGQTVEGKFYGSADDTTRRALEWLEARERADRPFFLFVHYFDPHDPYLPPQGYQPPFTPDSKTALKIPRTIFLYDTLLAFTDREIGRLLDGLARMGLDEDTVVIVTGDHGEGLMQRGHMFHGVHIYEEGVRVPLIARWPGHLPEGRVLDAPVDLLDVAPTLLELVGAKGVGAFSGRSLVPVLRGDAEGEPERPIFLYRRKYAGGEVAEGIHARGEKHGVRVGRWKLIHGPEEGTLELFDLESDPEERQNLAAREPERAAELGAMLDEWLLANQRGAQEPVTLSEEDRRRLEALGYIE
jgi:arylsulfatase A-like enzyme